MPPGADLFNAVPQRIFLFQVGKCISLNSGVIFPFIVKVIEDSRSGAGRVQGKASEWIKNWRIVPAECWFSVLRSFLCFL